MQVKTTDSTKQKKYHFSFHEGLKYVMQDSAPRLNYTTVQAEDQIALSFETSFPQDELANLKFQKCTSQHTHFLVSPFLR